MDRALAGRPARVAERGRRGRRQHPLAPVGGARRQSELDALALSANVIGRHQYRTGDVDAALAGQRRSHRAAASRRAGSTRPTSSRTRRPPSPTARAASDVASLDPGRRSTPATSSPRSSACPVAGPRDAARRWAVAFGSKLLVVEPLAMGSAAPALGRPVRLALTRARGHRCHQPGPGRRAGGRGRCAARTARSPGSRPARVRRGRVLRVDHRVRSAAVLLAGPYRWDALDIRGLRRRDQPRRHRLLPRAGRPAGELRASRRSWTSWRRSSASTRSSCDAGTSSPRATPWRRRAVGPDSAPARSLERLAAAPAVAAPRRSLPDDEGVGRRGRGLAGRPGARVGRRAASSRTARSRSSPAWST